MKRKVKNAVLKTITTAAGFGFCIGILCMISESWIPTILCVVSGLWLAAFAHANELMYKPFWKVKKHASR